MTIIKKGKSLIRIIFIYTVLMILFSKPLFANEKDLDKISIIQEENKEIKDINKEEVVEENLFETFLTKEELINEINLFAYYLIDFNDISLKKYHEKEVNILVKNFEWKKQINKILELKGKIEKKSETIISASSTIVVIGDEDISALDHLEELKNYFLWINKLYYDGDGDYFRNVENFSLEFIKELEDLI